MVCLKYGGNYLPTILYLTILFFKNEEHERQSQTKAEGVQYHNIYPSRNAKVSTSSSNERTPVT